MSRKPVTRAGCPMWLAYGAARASGATAQAGTSQPNSSRRRSGRYPSTRRIPRSESPVIDPVPARPCRAGRRAIPARSSRAEARNDAASKASAPRGDTTASSNPPAPYPAICADWATIRIMDRPRMYPGPGGSTSGRTADRTPPVYRRQQAVGEQQPEQRGDRHPGDHHGRHQRRAEQITHHQDPAGRQPVGRRAEQHPAEQVGQEGQGHHRGGQRRGPGLLVDQHGQRDRGHHVAQHGDDVGQEHGPELSRSQYVPVPGPAGRRAGARTGGGWAHRGGRSHRTEAGRPLVSGLVIRPLPNLKRRAVP